MDESFTINDSVSTNNIIGVYAGDQIALLDNLHINAGARFDIFDQKVVNNAVAGILDASEDEQTKTGFSPSIGITYQPWKPLAIFANYTRSFLPQTAGTRSMDGRVFDPSYGRQYEGGLKAQAFEGKLRSTVAVFEITKTKY